VMAKRNAPAHPGHILLKRAMEPLGISRNQLARDLDVPVGRISDITNGKRGITADTALRFGRYFGTGPELWLRLQAEYDLDVARAANWSEIEQRVRILDTDDSVETGDIAPPGLIEAEHQSPPEDVIVKTAAAEAIDEASEALEESGLDIEEDIAIPPAPDLPEPGTSR
jgi:addiction module HigA family antidote